MDGYQLMGSHLTRGGGDSFRRRRGCDSGRTRAYRGSWLRGSGREGSIAALLVALVVSSRRFHVSRFRCI